MKLQRTRTGQLSLAFNQLSLNLDPSTPLNLDSSSLPETTTALRGVRLILKVGEQIADLLTQQQRISPQCLATLMSDAAGGSDAQGHWHWKAAYEATEVALIHYLRQHRSPDLAHLQAIQRLLPTHTRRSQAQIEYQQFSTPMPLAYVVAQAAQIQPHDLVLEPSTGNGILAIWVELSGAKLILNELHPERRDTLNALFPNTPISLRCTHKSFQSGLPSNENGFKSPQTMN